ncbi:MAG: MBOAT family O-acyltransferase [Candidatus Shapirobacteria bacterium]|jgi:D-alanyl-lipoteichoic acid acyltransferase DltB (MBOAT superfamily)
MSFLSNRFILFFLAVWGLSIVLRPHKRVYKSLIVIASFVFYGFFGIYGVLVLTVDVLINYGLIRLLERDKAKREILGLAVGFNVLFLAAYKYFNVFAEGMAGRGLGVGAEIIVPVGISFITFKIISVLVDSYRQKIRVKSLADYIAFVSFFPQITAGPIGRYREFEQDLNRLNGFGVDIYKLETGRFWTLMIGGWLKMYLIGGALFEVVNQTINSPQSFGRVDLLLGMVSLSFFIYANFSGYSDMSEAVAGALGFRTPKNFDDPYRSGGVGEFWQRWHISLSSWLRDYLYIPLGGNRKGMPRKYFNLLATMTIGGVWHGVGVNFLVWGGIHGVMLVLDHALGNLIRPKFVGITKGIKALFKGVGWLLTFGLINITWIIFYPKNIGFSIRYLENLVGSREPLVTLWSVKLGCVLVLSGILSVFGGKIQETVSGVLTKAPWVARYFLLIAIFYLIILFGPSTYVAPAAYFNF